MAVPTVHRGVSPSCSGCLFSSRLRTMDHHATCCRSATPSPWSDQVRTVPGARRHGVLMAVDRGRCVVCTETDYWRKRHRVDLHKTRPVQRLPALATPFRARTLPHTDFWATLTIWNHTMTDFTERLPVELLVEILGHASVPDILRLKQVRKPPLTYRRIN